MQSLIRIISSVCAAGLFLSACTPSSSMKVAHSSLQREVSPNVANADMSALVNGNNDFAFSLYQSVHTGEGNQVFSPYSISLALAMTYAGARGQTESQMAEALHFTLPQERLHPAFDKFDLALQDDGKNQSDAGQPLQLNIANALWAEQTYMFLQPFLDLLATNYGAGLQQADFINQPAGVRQNINQWVSEQTHQKIKDLIPNGAINSLTRLILVNAIYFKGDWVHQFDSNDTNDAPFNLLDGSVSQVKMMSKIITDTPFSSGDGFKAVELNYVGNTAAMDILVPDEGKFTDFESQLNADKFNSILAGFQPTAVALGLPKFTFTSESDLGAHLSALGMSDAFDPNLADFSGMTGNHDLFVSSVLHKAFVAVDEKGTEAAAATSAIMGATSIMQPSENLTVDRPFIFIIRDINSNQILFIGRVLDPTK